MDKRSTMRMCAAIGLACLFAGIWLNESVVLPKTALASSDFEMRIMSLIIYASFFVVVRRVFRRRQEMPQQTDELAARFQRRFLLWSGIVGIALFFIGAVWFRMRMASGIPISPEEVSSSAVMFFLMKCFGAPISVGLVCLYAKLNSDESVRIAAAGMFGAFAVDAFVSWLNRSGMLSEDATFVLSAVLIVAALAFAWAGERQSAEIAENEVSASWLARPGNRTVSDSLSKNFIISAVLASVVLGFFRGSTATGVPYTSPLAAALLIVLAVVLWRQSSWGTKEVFRAAAFFVAAGVFLAPAIDPFLAGGGETLTSVGTALFELAVWLLAVQCTRDCVLAVVAAAGARLVMVIGHLAGSGIALVSLQAQSMGFSLQASSQLVFFAYIVVLLVFFRNPNENLSLRSHLIEEELSQASAAGNDETGDEADDAAADEGSLDKEYYGVPCAAVAEEYGLTPREQDVLEQLARGRTLTAMSQMFFLSPNTVKMHIKHIYQKMDVHSKQDVINAVDKARG